MSQRERPGTTAAQPRIIRRLCGAAGRAPSLASLGRAWLTYYTYQFIAQLSAVPDLAGRPEGKARALTSLAMTQDAPGRACAGRTRDVVLGSCHLLEDD